MSRSIKFRTWHEKDLRFYYFDIETVTQTYYTGYYHPISGEKDCELTDPTLYSEKQLYTGLKDKNGVEIYEGDILGCGLEIAAVMFDQPTCRFIGVSTLNVVIPVSYLSEKFEVIGNIYKNPELLEPKGG